MNELDRKLTKLFQNITVGLVVGIPCLLAFGILASHLGGGAAIAIVVLVLLLRAAVKRAG